MSQATAQDALREGRNEEARDLLERAIAAGDADPGTRLVLFVAKIKLQDFVGAKSALDDVLRLAPASGPLTKRLESCAAAEWTYVNRLRDPQLAGQRMSFGTPSAFALAYVRATTLHASGAPAEAAAALKEADGARPRTPGVLTTTKGERVPFSDLFDTDDLTGATLPLFFEGKVYDVPFAEMKTLTFHEAEDPFELMWPRVTFELLSGTRGTVASPALYPGSSAASDTAVRLGRTTVWDHDRGYAVAQGLRDFWVVGENGERRMMGLVHFARLELGARPS